jgi:threonine aldolase
MHVYHYEGGGASFNSGVLLLDGTRGMITAEQVGAINDPSFINPLTSLVCVENTTNKGGACYELEDLQKSNKFVMLII